MIALPLLLMTAPLQLRTYDVRFVKCYDGDTCTFDVMLDCGKQGKCGLGVVSMPNAAVVKTAQHVRLCDINAPELHPGPNPKAIKARDDLIGWIMEAKKVQIEVPQRDGLDEYEKFGRLLAYIVADGVNLNQRQVQRGNAAPFIRCR